MSLSELEDAWHRAITAPSSSHDEDRGLLNRIVERSEAVQRQGGGEGEAHKKLKEHVRRTPSIVGLPAAATRTAEPEYKLASHDSVDVMFCHGAEMVAVEVKSITSKDNVDDVRRGLYQCIKYKAVTEAMLKDHNEDARVRSVLVLGFRLPKRLRDTRDKLGVEVIEGVSPDTRKRRSREV